MFLKLRNLIFKLDPEIAHSLAIKTLKFDFLSSNHLKKFNSLETELFGIKLVNPIGIAAGFDKDAEVYNSLFKLGFGFVEVGTVTPLKQYGNPKPRIFRLEEDEALINRLGFNNSGVKAVSTRIKSNSPKGFFGINIGPNSDTKNRIEDYLICLRSFYNLANYLTINISSPNTKDLRSFHDKKELEELLNAIKIEKTKLTSNIPIAIKISPDITKNQIEEISDLMIKFKVELAIVSNTTDGNREHLKNINKLERGGLSGKPLENKSNFLIKEFYKIFKNKIKIIGVGGVDTGKSAYEKISSGASLVQLYTGMVYRGPNIVTKISSELSDILKKEGIKKFDEIIGSKLSS